jgi:hypothetical protein
MNKYFAFQISNNLEIEYASMFILVYIPLKYTNNDNIDTKSIIENPIYIAAWIKTTVVKKKKKETSSSKSIEFNLIIENRDEITYIEIYIYLIFKSRKTKQNFTTNRRTFSQYHCTEFINCMSRRIFLFFI